MAGKTEFTRFELCELVTESEVNSLGGGASEGEATNNPITGDEVCQWSAATSIVVGFGSNAQSSNLQPSAKVTLTPTTIDGLNAVQSLDKTAATTCQVVVDITDHSILAFVASVLTQGEGKYEPCDVANKLAKIVIPKVRQK